MANDKEFLIQVRADIEKAVADMRKLSGEIGKTGKESKRAATDTRSMGISLKGLAAAAGAYLSVASALKALKMADEWSLLQQRIKLATKETGDYNKVSQDLYTISQRNGAALADTVSTFQRLSLARKELGATNEEIIKVTNAVQQLGAMSGASTGAMQAGLLQFSQAMSAGTVRAEELNSILENIPAVATRIAQGMGLTVGELRQAVLDGKVLSREVFDALLSQSGEIAAEMAEMPVTLDRAWTAATNSLGNFLGRLNEISGLTGLIAESLQNWSLTIDNALKPENELSKLQERRLALLERIRKVEASIQSGNKPGALLQGYEASLKRLRDELALLEDQIRETYDRTLPGKPTGTRPPETKPSAGGTKDGKAGRSGDTAIVSTIQSLELEAATYGMTAKEIALYRLELEGATEAQLARASAALESIEADDEFAAAVKASEEAVKAENAAMAEFNAAQAQYLRVVIDSVDPTFKLTEELKNLEQLMARFPEHADLIGEAMLNVHEQMDKLVEGSDEAGKQMSQFAIQAARNIQDAFADGLFDIMQGNFDDIGNNFKRMLDRMIANAIAAKIGEKLFGGLAGGGAGGEGLLGGFLSQVFAFHQGGIVGQGGTPRMISPMVFAGAKRYHGGGIAGLAPNEVPAILQKGERVMTAEQQRNGAGVINLTVNINNPTDAASFRRSESQLGMEITRALSNHQRRLG